MDVSIIIVNYNTVQLAINAIDSVLAKTDGVTYEIIVVDNDSNDNIKAVLAEKYGDRIICLSLSENIGFGRANNEAAKISNGRNLFLLNPDTILLNNAVKILSDYLDDNPRVGCCGGNLVDINEKPIHSFCRYAIPSLFDEISQMFCGLPTKYLYRENTFYNHTDKPLKVCYITGADLMIRKELFDELHGFDPDFFMYYEETELEYRVRKAKYKIISVPYARIVHLVEQSFSNRADRMKNFYASQAIFLQKTHSPVTMAFIKALSIFNIKLRLFIFTLLRNKAKIALWSRYYKLRHGLEKELNDMK